MTKVILTGFAGFIGSYVLDILLKKGYFVIGIDNLSEGSDLDNFDKEASNFIPIYMDIQNPSLHKVLDSLILDKEDFYIVNCAADSHVDRSWDQVSKFIDSNIKGPLNLADWGLKKKSNLIKFVQVSTDEVWGGAPQPFTEDSVHAPENIYSSTKASAEVLLSNYHKGYGLPLVITNGANTYGPRQMEEKIIPKSIKRIFNKQKIPLYKTPARRMWLHARDHADGIVRAMESGVVGERYCLSPDSSQELYTRDLVYLICDAMKVDPREYVEEVPDRLNYDTRYFMLNDKAISSLGFEPQHDIKKELANLVIWYLEKYEDSVH